MPIPFPLLVCLVGMAVWIIFAKTKLADPLAARTGEIAFAVGLFVYVLNYGK